MGGMLCYHMSSEICVIGCTDGSAEHDCRDATSQYLDGMESSEVSNLDELIKFNEAHADVELPKGTPRPPRSLPSLTRLVEYPDQTLLINASQNRPSEDLYARATLHLEETARTNGLDRIFKEKGLDLLAMSMDCQIHTMAAASGLSKCSPDADAESLLTVLGYPIGTVPLGLLDHNGRPFGMGVMAPPGREDLLFRFMSAFETGFPKRMTPPGLVGSD